MKPATKKKTSRHRGRQRPIFNGNNNRKHNDTIVVKRTKHVQTREAWVAWTQVIANVLIPLGLIIAALGLVLQNWQTKVDSSSRRIELFYSEQLTAAQATLFSIWTDDILELIEDEETGSEMTQNFIDEVIETAISSAEASQTEINAAIIGLTIFFDRAESCISNSSCDEAEILSETGQYGRDFYCLFRGQILKLRYQLKVSQTFGAGAKDFAQRSGGCSN